MAFTFDPQEWCKKATEAEVLGIEVDKKQIQEYIDVVFGYSEYHTPEDPKWIRWAGFSEVKGVVNNLIQVIEYDENTIDKLYQFSIDAMNKKCSSFIIPSFLKEQGKGSSENIKEIVLLWLILILMTFRRNTIIL